jgi:hypothetical protein
MEKMTDEELLDMGVPGKTPAERKKMVKDVIDSDFASVPLLSSLSLSSSSYVEEEMI